MSKASVLIPCATPTCEALELLPYDAPFPKLWLCSACLDHIEAQHAEAQWRAAQARGPRSHAGRAVFTAFTSTPQRSV